MDNIYTNDDYWKKNNNFHEEDAAYKAEQCFKLLSTAGVTDSIKTGIDIGCGSGKFLTEMVAVLPVTLKGIDVSETPIKRAQENNKSENITFSVGDASQITETYDIAFLNDVFEHIDDYIGFLRSIRHVAKLYYFNIPLDMHVSSVLRHRYMQAREAVGHLHYFSEPSALATLNYAGYTIVDKRHNSHTLHSLRTHPSVRKYLAALPRLLTYKIAPAWSVHLLGGASLGVLCRPAP